MFVKFDRPKNSAKGNTVTGNKGSCMVFAEYLDKESKESKRQGLELDGNMSFFDHNYDTIHKTTAINRIDKNVKKLKHTDSKFFTLSINPSHKEIQHVIEITTGKKNIQSLDELNGVERKLVYAEFRDYTRNTMDLYAQNFNREKIKSGNDLVYFARIEKQRKYNINDKAVKEGTAIKGELKPGLNLHVQLCISRNDISQTVTLSPLIQTKARSIKFNGKIVQQGFDHSKFKMKTAALFSVQYSYEMDNKEKWEAQRKELNQRREVEKNNKKVAYEIENLANKFGTKIMNAMLPPEVLESIYLVKSGLRAVKTIQQLAKELSAIKNQKFIHKDNDYEIEK